MNKIDIRQRALKDAAKVTCPYCDNRMTSHNAHPVHGPEGSGNWIHTRIDGGKSALCLSSSILNMIEYERNTGPSLR